MIRICRVKKRERATTNESLCEIANLAFRSGMIFVYPFVWITSNTSFALSKVGEVPEQKVATIEHRWHIRGRKVFVERLHVDWPNVK